jgi:hypothetical protein
VHEHDVTLIFCGRCWRLIDLTTAPTESNPFAGVMPRGR